ncbi:MAG: protein kinase domain-containing protein [Myxococcota bacterium]
MSTLPKLSRFEVLGRLATGGMAEVWLARVLGAGGFQKLVVLKTILPHLAADPTFVSMFVNEGRLAAMLSHPNCVQVFDLGQENGWLYISMEYVEGFSLSRLLKRAKERQLPPPEKILARIAMEAASGLEYAHKLKDREGRHLQLVHRDVSPDNLLISFSGQTKLVDFGIARAVTPALLAAATSAGHIKGKHGFISPEYLLGQPLDARADLFALGVVLYRALTRKRPFPGATDAEISLSVINDTPPPPVAVNPGVSPALSQVVMMALEKDPAARFDSARAMRQAIEVAVVRAAEPEDVAEYMNQLWPPGDPERVSLESLANGRAEEDSSPALRAFDSGLWAQPATPARGTERAAPMTPLAVQPAPPTAEELTRELPRSPSGVYVPPLVDDAPQLRLEPTPPTAAELMQQLAPPAQARPSAAEELLRQIAPAGQPPPHSPLAAAELRLRPPAGAPALQPTPPTAEELAQPLGAAARATATGGTWSISVGAPPAANPEPPRTPTREGPLATDPSLDPVSSFGAVPSFDAPPRRRGWTVPVVIAVVVLIAVGLGGLLRNARGGATVVAATSDAPPPVAAQAAPSTTTAHVKLAPPVAVKVLDGKDELGTTPLEKDFPPGPRTLKLVNRALGIDQTLSLELAAGAQVVVDTLARGALVVKAEPWADVKVDGRALGQTPVTVKSLYEGPHVVELTNVAFGPRRLEVRVRGGETKVVQVDLTEEE